MMGGPLQRITWQVYRSSYIISLGEWRVLYVARFANAIYVLHAFRKKTQKTRREDIQLARQRYQQIEE